MNRTNKRIIFLVILLGYFFSYPNLVYGDLKLKKTPKNGFIKNVSSVCKSLTSTCSNEILEVGDTDQTKNCVTCCDGEEILNQGEKCFNYCICECSLKANPTSPNTRKLCKKKK